MADRPHHPTRAPTRIGPLTERLLIVSADDFGLTPGVCRGILRAHADGLVTSTSALTVAPAFHSHAAALRDAGIDVGVHLAIVGEDPPLLSAREVPSLVDRTGRFPLTWRRALARLAAGRVDPADVEREFSAQVEAVTSAGLRPSHVDAHQHLHLWPAIGHVALRVAARAGVRAMRVVRSGRWNPSSLGVRALSAALARDARRAAVTFPDTTIGFDHAGSLDLSALEAELDRCGPGLAAVELCAHPGEQVDPDRDRYAWGYAWGDELELMCSPAARDLVGRRGFRLGTYADLVDVAGS